MTKKMQFKTPLVGRITKLKRTWWAAYVPAIGAIAQSNVAARRGVDAQARRLPTDRVLREATIHRLNIIGVAAAATTKAFRGKFASVPWRDAIPLREFLGKPDERLDQDALRKALRETVPALMKALARPDFEVAEVIRLNITQAEAKALRKWGAKKPKKRKRGTRPAPARQAATTRSRQNRIAERGDVVRLTDGSRQRR